MNILSSEHNFLGITEENLCNYEQSKVVIQQVPYEHTSSYLAGSDKGPAAMLEASHYVEFFDEMLDDEPYKKCGIATLEALDFTGKTDKTAVDYIKTETAKHLNNNKFVVSFGAEHTVSNGFVQAYLEKYPKVSVLQLDAHSDLRMAYQGNPYSHASVMARVVELGVKVAQLGIRAQCIEEREWIKREPRIETVYAHQVDSTDWHNRLLNHLTDEVYITIDADGFDPSIMPAVGTAEPGGLQWFPTLAFLEKVFQTKKVVGFDIVECAPMEGSILSEFTLAKLAYRLIGYKTRKGDW
jgi:agmatinase